MPYLGHMTIAPDAARRPVFTIGDRLRKARMLTGLEVREFALRLQVDRNTVTNYELERTAVERMKPLVLREWAMASGVDHDWLLHGDSVRPGGDDPRGIRTLATQTDDLGFTREGGSLAEVIALRPDSTPDRAVA